MSHPETHHSVSTAEACSLALLHRAQAGDQEALNSLVSDHYDRLRNVVRRAMGPRLRSLEESVDVVQETLITAVDKIGQFESRGPASLFRWLAKIADRQVLRMAKYWRASKRDGFGEYRLEAPAATTSESNLDPAAADTQPADRIANAEQAAIMRSCVDELETRHQRIVMLRNDADRSWNTIASLTGRSNPNAARMAHARAMEKLAGLARDRLSVTS